MKNGDAPSPGRGFGLAYAVAGVLLFAAAPAPLRAAARGGDIWFNQISIEQGLSQSIVECVIQDTRGFIWIGTEDGVNMYDGYRCRIIRNDPDDPNSLSYNQVLSICEDRHGYIWFGTFHGGLNRYDPVTERFTLYLHDDADSASLSHNSINSIYETRAGDLWIGTDDGLNRYDRDADRFTTFRNDPKNPNSPSHNFIRRICEAGAGTLWIGTDGGGLNRFDPATGAWTRFMHDPADPASLSHNSVRAICEDRSGDLWIGTVGGGLNRLDRRTGTFRRYAHDANDPASLSFDQIYDVFEDRSGALWIGTNGGGLDLFDRATGSFLHYRHDPNDPNSLSYDEIRDIFEDRSRIMWIGTYGGGVNTFDTKRKKFHAYRPNPSSPENSLSAEIVWSIYEDEQEILWIGTHGGGLNRLDRATGRYTRYRHDPADPNSLSGDIVRIVYRDRSGVFWIGTHGGGLCRFDRASGRFTAYRNDPNDPRSLSHDEIRSIYEDRRGVLWIGTNGGGLNRFDRESGAFTRYRRDPNDSKSLSNDFVRTLHEDATGIFWVGTQGGGLDRMDRESGAFTHHRVDRNDPASISNDYIFSLYEDSRGDVWIGTWGGGLNRLDRGSGAFKHYTMKDGLPNNSIYGILEDGGGYLWLSTNYGLSKFDPVTETFKNYTVEDGLLSNEFNGGSFFESVRGEMFFGGIHGFNSFFPHEIKDNPFIPPVVITSFSILNAPAQLDTPITDLHSLKLSHRDYLFSFEFAALDYSAPGKNQYAYMMEGLDKSWIRTTADRRYATFTTLPPGRYVFRVKGSNNDGVWNESPVSIAITITPPYWRTPWFRLAAGLAVAGIAAVFYRRRLVGVRLAAELRAAHRAQMSIMPQKDPEVGGFDVSGICLPAYEVGGDFYDYFRLGTDRRLFAVAVGDVAGKAMDAAMISVMSSGMLSSRVDETDSVASILRRMNRPLFEKTGDYVFTSLCLLALDAGTHEATFSIAGFNNPIVKSGSSVRSLAGRGPQFPLGSVESVAYEETTVRIEPGDVLFVFSDGLVEERNKAGEFYGLRRLRSFIAALDTGKMPARLIKESIVADVLAFSGKKRQDDDITLVVAKAK